MPKCAICGRFSLLAAAVYHCAECGKPVCRPSHSDCSVIVEWTDRKLGQAAVGLVYKDPKIRCRNCVTQRAIILARQALAVWTTCPKCGSQLEMSYDAGGLRCSQKHCPWHPQDLEGFADHATRGQQLVRAGELSDAAREYEMAGLFTEAGRIRRMGYKGEAGVSGHAADADVNELLRRLALSAPVGAAIACPRCAGQMSVWAIQGSHHRCPNCGWNLRVADLVDDLKALL
jgi:hypothetical protein